MSRDTGSLWAVYSPRMVFEAFELYDEVGLGQVMTEFLGERPVLSANKCTLRRVPCENMLTGWHQDGAFLGDDIGSFNFWVTFTRCGIDAPGMDIVPKRFDRVLQTGGEGAVFRWSLSDQTVTNASDGVPIVRPEFEAGDALLFDHRLVHRTASSAKMVRERYAIESWFFTPSKYPPVGQIPLLY
jgi:ectoine hydroxylase-related dioxygenase (phytanoyl-CoA dioxygenase family)